jgi:Asp-tRNA(Asn)/Glu-tRNA(Gln) amidotransferase A subunit family amidase
MPTIAPSCCAISKSSAQSPRRSSIDRFRSHPWLTGDFSSLGIGGNGVPTGLQIAAKAYDDIAVFRVAAAFESTWERPFRSE